MINVAKVGQWEQASSALSIRTIRRFQAAQNSALKQEAKYVRKMLVTGLRKRAPGGKKLDRLSSSTLASRRFLGIKGNRPLIATGDFLDAIEVSKVAADAYFIGVLTAAKTSKGKSIASIIEFQEKGGMVAIKLTPKVLAFLRKSGMKRRRKSSGGGRKVMLIRIKPRPVFEPAKAQYMKDARGAEGRLAASITKRLGGLYGFAG